jgi:hypothetical protein
MIEQMPAEYGGGGGGGGEKEAAKDVAERIANDKERAEQFLKEEAERFKAKKNQPKPPAD